MDKRIRLPKKRPNQLYDEFCIDGKYGVKNKIGDIIIEAVFDNILINENDRYVIFSLDGKKSIVPLSEISNL